MEFKKGDIVYHLTNKKVLFLVTRVSCYSIYGEHVNRNGDLKQFIFNEDEIKLHVKYTKDDLGPM